MRFIRQLPQSLQELYQEINGDTVTSDESEDFHPVCNLGTKIFTALHRLHTCDIHAWISNIEGETGYLPEKCVFYRRPPRQGSKVKDVWTSTMECVYQESNVIVDKECMEVELEEDEGDFEGRDADEVWAEGFSSDKAGLI
jgi:hypothetical protein